MQSLSRPRQCWDNAVAESFFATLKLELIDRRPWATRAQARRAVFEFIEGFYNRRRLHSSLGYITPVDQPGAEFADAASIRQFCVAAPTEGLDWTARTTTSSGPDMSQDEYELLLRAADVVGATAPQATAVA